MAGRTIVVGVDGSENGYRAFHWTLDNIWREGDTVVAAHSVEYGVSLGMPGFSNAIEISNSMAEEQTRVDHLIAKYAEILKKKHIPGKAVKCEGQKPGDAIVQTAQDCNANIIVTGTRGLGKFRKTILGSVSDYVVQHASIPVILFRE